MYQGKEAMFFELLISAFLLPCSTGDEIEMNYHSFDVGFQCTSFSWQYFGQDCRPATFSIQAFSPNDLQPVGQEAIPRLSINSSSAVIKLPTRVIKNELLYFTVHGVSAGGISCDPNPQTYYNFAMLVQDDTHVRTKHRCVQGSSLCFNIPRNRNNDILLFIWPKTLQSADRYCTCQPRTFGFVSCEEYCPSSYRFSFGTTSLDVLCLQNSNSLQNNQILKVYFVYRSRVCSGTQCLYTYISSYWMSHQYACNENTEPVTSPTNILNYSRRNFTASSETVLVINVTHDAGPNHQLVWRHNGYAIDIAQDARISLTSRGGLRVEQVDPSDAGNYEAIVSNSQQCDNASFVIFIEYFNMQKISAFSLSEGAMTFGCLAHGYPEIRLLMWQKATGAAVSLYQYNHTSQNSRFNSSLSSFLHVNTIRECIESRGYVCTLAHGNRLQAITFHCPPGPPSIQEVQYFSDNHTLCLNSYSHPDYPVLAYVLNNNNIMNGTSIVINASDGTTSYTPQCTTLVVDVACNQTLQFSITAVNSLGSSEESQHNIQNYSVCDMARRVEVEVEVDLYGINECESWIQDNTDAKLEAFGGEIVGYVIRNCQCGASNVSFARPMLRCWENSTDHVTFTASLIYKSNSSQSQQAVLETIWRLQTSKLSFSVLGETLVVVDGIGTTFMGLVTSNISTTTTTTSTTISNTATTANTTQIVTSTATSGVALHFSKYWPLWTLGIVALLLFIGTSASMMVYFIHKRRKRKISSKVSKERQPSPIYEEVESLSPVKDVKQWKFATCEAYGVAEAVDSDTTICTTTAIKLSCIPCMII